MSSNFEDAAERKKRLERELRITRSKERARDYEQKNEWADALRLYTEVLKDDPEDEEAQIGVQRMRESLIIQLYARGMEELKAGEWAAAVAIFDQLLDEAKKAGRDDYQDARARRQEAQDHITPPPPPRRVPPKGALVGIGVIGGVVIVALIAVLVWILWPNPPPPEGPTEPTGTLAIVTTEEPTEELTEEPTEPPGILTTVTTEGPTEELTEEPTEPPGTLVSVTTDEPTEELTTGPTEATKVPTEAPTKITTMPPTKTPTPTEPPPLTGKIAVPVFDTKAGVYNVYIAWAKDGWQPKFFFENGSQPAFSPDGQQIILRSWRQAAQGGCGQRLVLFPSLDTKAEDARRMTHNLEDAHPSLSRSGEIVFHSRRTGSSILFALGTWPGAESTAENQAELVPGENPDWLGDRIVYYAYEPLGLYVRNADGSVELVLSEQGPLAPSAAPDDDHVAVSLKRGEHWHVFVLSVSQGKSSLTQLTSESAQDLLPVWSPDGQSIAFVSNRGGGWAIWVMDAVGTNQRKLFDLNGTIDGIVFGALDQSRGWVEERLSWAP